MAKVALVDRYWPKVDVRGPDECWLWNACLNSKGYGSIRDGRVTRLATHVALELAGRPRLQNLDALHSCDTPACCNPAHLRWGTHAENMGQMAHRRRHIAHRDEGWRQRAKTRLAKLSAEKHVRGEQSGTAKLTDGAVRKIRSANGTCRVIADEFGVSAATVSRVRRGLIWAHVQ